MVELDPKNWTPAEQAEFAAKGWRSRRPGEFPPCMATVRPADYVDDFHRGTVEYDPQWRNYSYHTVEIPAGADVQDCNFSQADPKTPAVVLLAPEKPTNFVNCNFANIELSPTHVVARCNVSQGWTVETLDASGVLTTDRVQIATHPDEIQVVPPKPPNAVKPIDQMEEVR